MKTKEVTLPPLFSGWDSNLLADGRPPVRAEPRPRASRDWLTCKGCRFG